jgi:hypothetical protein
MLMQGSSLLMILVSLILWIIQLPYVEGTYECVE